MESDRIMQQKNIEDSVWSGNNVIQDSWALIPSIVLEIVMATQSNQEQVIVQEYKVLNLMWKNTILHRKGEQGTQALLILHSITVWCL